MKIVSLVMVNLHVMMECCQMNKVTVTYFAGRFVFFCKLGVSMFSGEVERYDDILPVLTTWSCI